MANYCTKCGGKLEGKPSHCPKCGAEIKYNIKDRKYSRPQSTNHEKILLKSYLIFGIIAIIVSLFLIFGMKSWDDKILLSGEILIIFSALFLIVLYNQIFHGKKYAAIATIGCIIGISGSFFPAVLSFDYALNDIIYIVIPAVFFILMIFFLAFLILTLLWRTK